MESTSATVGRSAALGGSILAYSSLVGTEDADSEMVNTSKQTKSSVSLFALAETANNSPCSWDILFISPSPSFMSFSTMRWRKGTLNGGTRMRYASDWSMIGPPAMSAMGSTPPATFSAIAATPNTAAIPEHATSDALTSRHVWSTDFSLSDADRPSASFHAPPTPHLRPSVSIDLASESKASRTTRPVDSRDVASALFAVMPPRVPNAEVAAAPRSDWTSLAEGSLHARRRRRDAGRGKTGTNLPVRESHASLNRTVGDLAAEEVDDAVG
mmetsp:Transcript_18789/g.40288  ORF Transcript_18789/g.40288 Transcript_18789/m.40288 type:complete len:271 (+) Transcript_18789:196-1008(+)